MIDGKTIHDVLQITFDDITDFFEAHLPEKTRKPALHLLSLILKTGLGHLGCGRSLKTLSAGEFQRLKLVTGLAEKRGNKALILLDEPTGGLHPKDIAKLLTLFNEVLDEGNTLVCVTHEPLLMAAANTILELGPGGGLQGGRIV
jgi:excinuclease ABC subunit A